VNLLPHIEQFCKRRNELESALSTPNVAGDSKQFLELTREYSQMKKLAELGERYLKLLVDINASRQLIQAEPADSELAELAREELPELEVEQSRLELELQYGIIPPNLTDSRDTIVEIRAGAGGAESALFCADLHRMYARYAESQGWKVQSMDASASDLGGYKEVIFGIKGQDVFKKLKFESGVHRVQRVPATETQGRVHTSTVTVAVLPEAEDVDIDIKPDDLEINVCRASGPGGQGVNTTDSAVQIQHKPSGMIVRCMDGRSQQKNKEQAMKVLRSRLLEQKIAEEHAKYAAERKSQIGTGERNERIRTYNFSQNRVTDHRIDLTLYNLPTFIEGEINEVVTALLANDLKERLAALE
jgi:peptide chain release factor 1|tara:strand:- start:683 stop:1759 length:1077 start_codon:yes stop_codon:yes gene_type:complete